MSKQGLSSEEGKSKRQRQIDARREKAKVRNRRKQTSTMIAVVIVAVLLVAILIYPSLQPLDITFPPNTEYPMANENSMGDPDAPVQVVEYANFTCSHCANFSVESQSLIIQDYIKTGKVYFTYQPFVSTQDASGFRAAEAAFCASDQGKFWDMHDAIFYNFEYAVRSNGFSQRSLDMMAEHIGLDMNAFGACMNAGTYKDTINNALTAGRQAGISVTPTFLVNGAAVVGDDPQSLIREIESALASAGE